jgi:hypothetical protein
MFEMTAPIQSPAKCEVRLGHLVSQCKVNVRWKFTKIGVVYGDIVYWQNVTECCELSEGRVDVHTEQRSGGSSLISADPLQKTEGETRVNQHRTVTE